jgi:hypothetical protein
VEQRREDLSGDYEYDMAHERSSDRESAREDQRGARPGPAPAGREVESDDQDMSYDEAHDFRGRDQS